jgi:lecithin-cholesterol acyltransferase
MKFMRSLLVMLVLLSILTMFSSPVSAHGAHGHQLTPVILFPGWTGTRLAVSVNNQAVAPECPRSGKFEYFLLAGANPDFSQACVAKLLTLVVKFDPRSPKALPSFSEQRGVSVRIADYGKTESSPLYENLYAFLESVGYTRNVNIRVAGYDSRLTPDMGGFMERTVALIEETYRENRNTPVHLVGHSNGPLYIQYLLTHTSQQWKNKYIQGFTSLAGNLPGQGSLYSMLFTGFNVMTVSYPADLENAAASAAMLQSHPSSYMSASNPAYFKDQEVVVRDLSSGKAYTPQDYKSLFKDAKMELAQKLAPLYLGFVKFQAPYFPNVDVYAERGSGLDTMVGIVLPDLSSGQLLTENTGLILMSGDSNQEDLTNLSVMAWQAMPCYHFEMNDNPGVDHLSLALATQAVWDRLLAHTQLPRTQCGNK